MSWKEKKEGKPTYDYRTWNGHKADLESFLHFAGSEGYYLLDVRFRGNEVHVIMEREQ